MSNRWPEAIYVYGKAIKARLTPKGIVLQGLSPDGTDKDVLYRTEPRGEEPWVNITPAQKSMAVRAHHYGLPSYIPWSFCAHASPNLAARIRSTYQRMHSHSATKQQQGQEK